MSVTTKFGIVFLLSPFLTLVCFMFGVHYFYGISPDLFLDLIPALISTTVVVLLVWERLRGSLRSDFRWFHKYVLFELYEGFGFRMNLYYVQAGLIKSLRDDLEEYGRSMGLRLYPKELPEMIDKFLELDENFSPKLKEIKEYGHKELLNQYDFQKSLYYLGIEPIRYSSSIEEVEDAHRINAQQLKEKQPELVNEARDLLQEMRVTREQIHDLLDDFIKDNKLKLVGGRTYIPRP